MNRSCVYHSPPAIRSRENKEIAIRPSRRDLLYARKRYSSTLGLFVWRRKFSRYVIQVTGYLIRATSPGVLSVCTAVHFRAYTIRVSIVRLLKYDHQHPLIIYKGYSGPAGKSLIFNSRSLQDCKV